MSLCPSQKTHCSEGRVGFIKWPIPANVQVHLPIWLATGILVFSAVFGQTETGKRRKKGEGEIMRRVCQSRPGNSPSLPLTASPSVTHHCLKRFSLLITMTANILLISCMTILGKLYHPYARLSFYLLDRIWERLVFERRSRPYKALSSVFSPCKVQAAASWNNMPQLVCFSKREHCSMPPPLIFLFLHV